MVNENNKIKIAFVKFGGLAAGGTERWLQMMAANLPKDQFDIDYYYCDAAPYIGSNWKHPDTDAYRLKYMQEAKVNLIKFKVGFKDVTKSTHDWVDTNFWDVFDESKYDIIQTAKAGPAEYPYCLMKKPVVEFITLSAGVDFSDNIIKSIHLSGWQRKEWFRMGGDLNKSAIIPIPAELPNVSENFRSELGIPQEAVVVGMHQRNTEEIFSPIPLKAFAALEREGLYFVLMGGASKYQQQAKDLGLKNVRFVSHSGDSEKIAKFLNTLDVFAHGRADGETFGTVFAEAMMSGLPCLSHWTPIANAQAETMGPAGLFAKDLKDYIEKLRLLVNDKNLRLKLGSKGRDHAKKFYTVESCVDSLADIYQEIVGRGLAKPKISYQQSPMGFLYAGDATKKSEIAYHTMYETWPEEFDAKFVNKIVKTNSVFIDIGANTGLYCFLAAQSMTGNKRVLAYEPQIDCCEQIKETVYLNNWEDFFEIRNLGLADKNGELTLSLSGTGSSFEAGVNDQQAQEVILPVRTLDDDLKDWQSAVDFIKIDVEGFEYKVLLGAKETIAKYKPIIFVEIADQFRDRGYINKDYKKTIELLQSFGYKLYRFNGFKIKEVDLSDNRVFGLLMYLCLDPVRHSYYLGKLKGWQIQVVWDIFYGKFSRKSKKLFKKIKIVIQNKTRILPRIIKGLNNEKYKR